MAIYSVFFSILAHSASKTETQVVLKRRLSAIFRCHDSIPRPKINLFFLSLRVNARASLHSQLSHAHTRTRTHAQNAHAQTRTHAHAYTLTRFNVHTLKRAHEHKRTRAHAHTLKRAHALTRTRAQCLLFTSFLGGKFYEGFVRRSVVVVVVVVVVAVVVVAVVFGTKAVT